MPVINLRQPADSSDAILNAVIIKRDGSADENNLLFLGKLRFPILNVEEARKVGDLIPGAEEVWKRTANVDEGDTEKHNGGVKTPALGAVKGTIIAATGVLAGKTAVDGPCDVVGAELRSSRKETILVVTVRWGGQPASTAERLAALLGQTVNFSFSSQQGVLPFRAASPTDEADEADEFEVNLGDIASTESVTGQITEFREIDDEPVAIINDFGAEHIVPLQDVESSVTVDFAPKQMKDYEKQAKTAGGKPSWDWLMKAIAEQDEEKITAGTIKRAVEIQTEALKDAQPAAVNG